jgi:hypothetical protein
MEIETGGSIGSVADPDQGSTTTSETLALSVGVRVAGGSAGAGSRHGGVMTGGNTGTGGKTGLGICGIGTMTGGAGVATGAGAR